MLLKPLWIIATNKIHLIRFFLNKFSRAFFITCLVLPTAFSQEMYGQNPNQVNSIEIVGNNRTKTDYLYRFISLRTGETVDSNLINNDLRRLRNLSSIMTAKVSIQDTDSGQHIIYKLSERYTLFPVGDFGVTEDSYWIGGGIMESNLLGKGLYFYGYYQYNERHTAHLIFRNPYLYGSKWGFETQLKNIPAIEYYNDSIKYLNHFFSFKTAVRYEFCIENEIHLGTSIRRDEVENLDDHPDSDELLLNRQRFSQEFSLRHEIRKLDYHYFYVQGWKNEVYLGCLIPYDANYTPVVLLYEEFRIFNRIGNRGNIAMRFMAGISNEKNEVFNPFIADSYYNIRGVGYRAYRGNSMAIINLEYRHTLYENYFGALQGVLFSDSGLVHDTSARLSDKSLNLFSGVGLRFIYKKAYNAILCIDYGMNIYNRGNGGWVLGWGQYF